MAKASNKVKRPTNVSVCRKRITSEVDILALLAFPRMSSTPSGKLTTPAENTLSFSADRKDQTKATIDHFWYECGQKTWFFWTEVDRKAAARIVRKGFVVPKHPIPFCTDFKISKEGLQCLFFIICPSLKLSITE